MIIFLLLVVIIIEAMIIKLLLTQNDITIKHNVNIEQIIDIIKGNNSLLKINNINSVKNKDKLDKLVNYVYNINMLLDDTNNKINNINTDIDDINLSVRKINKAKNSYKKKRQMVYMSNTIDSNMKLKTAKNNK